MALSFQAIGASGGLDPRVFQGCVREILSSGLRVALRDFCCDAGLGDSFGPVVYSGREYVGELHLSMVFRDAFSILEREKFRGFRAEYVAGYCTDAYAGSCRGSAYAGYAVVMVWNLGSYRGDVVSRFLDGIRNMSCFLAEGDF